MITNDAAASLAINPTEHVKSINALSYDGNALMIDGVSLARKDLRHTDLCV